MNNLHNKTYLRNIYKEKRKKLSPSKLSYISKKILENLEDLNIWHYNYYHIFLTIKQMREIDTNPIIKSIWSKNKTVIIPKIEADKLDSYIFDPKTVTEKNKFNIYEPLPLSTKLINSIFVEVIFIPLLCFDKKGHRIGYGRGYYDKFLKTIPKALKIGLSAFEPIEGTININKFDIKMDYCVSCKRIYKFA